MAVVGLRTPDGERPRDTPEEMGHMTMVGKTALRRTACVLCLALSASALQAEGQAVSLSFAEEWGAVFAGKEAAFHVKIAADKGFEGRIGWHLSFKDRTVARGESTISLRPKESAKTEIHLQVPETREGVVIAAPLSVGAYAKGAEQSAATIEKIVWVFTEDPFADQKEWLKKLEIVLFDPEEKIAELFGDEEFPCRVVRNVDALDEMKAGFLLVGEGISFKDYRGLPGAMMKAASNGVPVLCLAPVGGWLELPRTGGEQLPKPKSITFKRRDVIKWLDKRLDAAWPPDGTVTTHTMTLVGERGPVLAEVMERPDGWPWLELDFQKKRGKLVVCEFRIVDRWNSGPTPRFLFTRLLEYLDLGKRRERK